MKSFKKIIIIKTKLQNSINLWGHDRNLPNPEGGISSSEANRKSLEEMYGGVGRWDTQPQTK